MSATEIDVQVDVDDAVARMDAIADELDAAGGEIVDQLVLLAEGAMKAEAPEGAGIPDVHMRDTIKATGRRQRRVVKPRKRTREGWLLHEAIVGSPSVPSWSADDPPPVGPVPAVPPRARSPSGPTRSSATGRRRGPSSSRWSRTAPSACRTASSTGPSASGKGRPSGSPTA